MLDEMHVNDKQLDASDIRQLERVMHVEPCYGYMDGAMERHPRAGGDPAHGDRLDSHVRGNDHYAASTLGQRSRVHNTL